MDKLTGIKLTNFIKIQLLKYFRFDKQFNLVFTEGINNSDVNALKDDCLIEVEVKQSKSDFLKEFDNKSKIKKIKHQRYIVGNNRKYKKYVVPNYFYFCIGRKTKDETYKLANFVVEYLKENGYNHYGVLICGENRLFNKHSHIETFKRATKIHSNKPNQEVFIKAYKRLSSELISLKEKLLTK